MRPVIMQLKNLKFEDLEIEVSAGENVLTLDWKGAIHAANPGDTLDPYIDLLIEELIKDGLALRCNFAGLEYMNSASIPPLIHLLRECADHEIQAEFTYDSSRKVQTASFRALEVIARKSKFTSVKGI